ncbi:cytochrome c family protein [Sphingomonas spermidinifaciens]|uniref:Cytochrome c family protein n=1 Tax=Sphingomonas spermidinifaciens TaxID=1141889 RepID=A0A2A4BA77_9SPHN|nr:cytochrome c family protein [Sphingomonas spermidinifaciens]PCD04669.1 cytochrome c family protein [Sphingomonas spermidinifaciens]
MFRTFILALALSGTAAAAQTGDPAKGKATFARCAACHSVAPGKNGVGPTLAGVVGRKAASVPGYRYSPAMQKSGLTWNAATIARFIAAPSKVVPGTKMMAPPVTNPQDQANIVAYLKTVSGK